MTLQDWIRSGTVFVKVYSEKLSRGENVAEQLFLSLENAFEDAKRTELKKNEWLNRVPEAAKTIKEWTDQSGKAQNWEKTDLARAWCIKDIANKFYQDHEEEFMLLESFHETAVKHSVKHDLGERLIEQGKKGLDLLAVEISARLAKSLNFPGSSAYLGGIIIPYNSKVREALGEKQEDSLVTKKAVLESAQNALRTFNVKNVLAETSIAPEMRVRKSRKEPRVYICEITNGNAASSTVEEHRIDTHFREKFDSVVRELMYRRLERMYK